MEDNDPNITQTQVGGETLEIVPLGAGREVGRSCIMIRFKGKLIMVRKHYTQILR